MKIGIVGLGVVGSAIKSGFERIGHEVISHDVKLYTKLEDILDTEVCYICVPTNSNEDGSCDVSIVHDVVRNLDKLDYRGIVAIKSTVEPGTSEKFRDETNLIICFVPEFLRERCAEDDFINHNSLLLVGTDDDEIVFANELTDIYTRRGGRTFKLNIIYRFGKMQEEKKRGRHSGHGDEDSMDMGY